MSAFDRADAAALVQLASFTELDLTDLGLPSPWRVIQTFTTSIGVQGYVAMGSLPSQPATTVALLAVGLSWDNFIENSLLGEHVLSFPPSGLVDDDKALADLGYSNFYESLRTKMWASVLFAKATVRQFTTAMPMVVTGLGPGAPLAQMAALDFRPSHKWGDKTSPATDMTEYAFSCVPAGNQAYASSFNTLVPAGYTVNLRMTSGVTVDFYPTGYPQNYVLAGKVQGADAKIADPDDPWVERDSPYYQQTLSAVAGPRQRATRAAQTGAATRLVDGYSPLLAYTMSRLSLSEYQRFQHPELPLKVPDGYSFHDDVRNGDVQWGSIYYSADRVVVAFRGLSTWQEVVTTWGSNRVAQPSWLSAGGRILTSYDAIYGGLRSDLHTKLRGLNMDSKPLVLTGHDVGGALASIAAYDMKLNPVERAPAPAGIYTFGAPPVGDGTFRLGYDGTMGAMSFQVVRPDDVIPKLDLLSVQTLPQQQSLPGGLQSPLNGSVYHALTVYSQLLDPFGGVVAAESEVTARAKKYHADAVRDYQAGKAEVHQCLLDTAQTDGKLTFSWALDGSYTPPWHDARDRAVHVLTDVVVRPGHDLVLEAPAGEEVRIFAQRLTLTPGARVRLATSARLHIGHLRVLDATEDARETGLARIDVVGTPGAHGVPGQPGEPGTNGAPGQAGGQGSHGGTGHRGQHGGNAWPANFFIDTLEGVLVVHVEGGAGGNGGNGGAGGNGGNGGSIGRGRVAPGGNAGSGGSGGTGGSAGAGSVVTIDVNHFTPGSHVVAETPQAPGGKGGVGGPGGVGGRGMPSGRAGAAGPVGTPGANGRAGTVIVRQA
ncbi:MAG TPA: hypothetical protein VF432_08850 [Thermoanaerobaculia bacterium]